MTAARGIIHSEMPQQEEGRMRGFQLWINLPASEKMKPAGYRDLDPSDIPTTDLPGGGRVKAIAGRLDSEGVKLEGAVTGSPTDPLYLDVELPAGARFTQRVAADYNAFVYAYEGSLAIGEREVELRSAALLSEGDSIEVMAGGNGARFLLLAARPLREPVVQYGPFVMNTQEEIEQALRDYQSGSLAAVPPGGRTAAASASGT